MADGDRGSAAQPQTADKAQRSKQNMNKMIWLRNHAIMRLIDGDCRARYRQHAAVVGKLQSIYIIYSLPCSLQ